jgi:ribosomal protein S18 acetylase RimI-like enzyme
MTVDPLDNPVWSALTGPHATVAQSAGSAVRYPAELAPFAALADDPDETAWVDAAGLPGSDFMVVVGSQPSPPPNWRIRRHIPVLQMVADRLEAAPEPEAIGLGPRDVPEMLDLVERTRPGPFQPRTIELGDYIGIRREGSLIAMAGERIRMPGWTEVSAVCTDPSARGTGLAGRLVRAVVASVRARGDEALLHVASTNSDAIRLYRSLGFVERREFDFLLVRAPQPVVSTGDQIVT